MSEAAPLTPRQKQILEFIDQEVRRRGYPPSVREIGEAVGLSSSSTVHAHLAALQDKGYLRRDPTKPRAIEVCFEPGSGAVVDRRPVVHVPLVGDVAAGTGVLAAENIEETMPLPEDLTGDGTLFMLRVRGDSMIEAGIFDRDYVVVRQQPTAENGDIVVAGIPGEEATVKTYLAKRGRITLRPANSALEDMVFEPGEVTVFGKVVTVMRRLWSAAVPAKISLVTLGVSDLERSGAFYDALGWQRVGDNEGVIFYRMAGAHLALFPLPSLAEDAHVAPDRSGFVGASLAINCADEIEVDAVFAHLAAMGATILKPAERVFWGGYSGYFADPDDFVWEVAYNPGWPLDERGLPQLE